MLITRCPRCRAKIGFASVGPQGLTCPNVDCRHRFSPGKNGVTFQAADPPAAARTALLDQPVGGADPDGAAAPREYAVTLLSQPVPAPPSAPAAGDPYRNDPGRSPRARAVWQGAARLCVVLQGLWTAAVVIVALFLLDRALTREFMGPGSLRPEIGILFTVLLHVLLFGALGLIVWIVPGTVLLLLADLFRKAARR